MVEHFTEESTRALTKYVEDVFLGQEQPMNLDVRIVADYVIFATEMLNKILKPTLSMVAVILRSEETDPRILTAFPNMYRLPSSSADANGN